MFREPLVNDADHLADNFKSYINGFSSNIQDIIKNLEFDKQIDKMDKNDRLLAVVKAFSEFDLDPVHIDNMKMGYIFASFLEKKCSEIDSLHSEIEEQIKVLEEYINKKGYDDIHALVAFSKYYTTTLLSNSVTPTDIYDIEAKLDGYFIIDIMDVDAVNDIIYSKNGDDSVSRNSIKTKERTKIVNILQRTKRNIEKLDKVSCFEDAELHKKYNFIIFLLSFINIKHPGGGFNLDGKIKAINFVQKKKTEHVNTNIKSDPIMKLPTAEGIN